MKPRATATARPASSSGRGAREPTFFGSPEAWRRWLERHHASAGELLVGFHKGGARRAGLRWALAVDQALCFGWIDGVRSKIDGTSYAIRFTPRRPGSTWSAVNIDRVAELERRGLMAAAGRRAFARRSEKRSRTYSYERSQAPALDAELRRELAANPQARSFFRAQAPSYRQKAIHWVMSAKTAATRAARLRRLMVAFAAGKKP
jgi:uncharacterized protein YdeI (YjbR/CyaY-like superfamily)